MSPEVLWQLATVATYINRLPSLSRKFLRAQVLGVVFHIQNENKILK